MVSGKERVREHTGRTLEKPTTQTSPTTSAAARRLTMPLAKKPARGLANMLVTFGKAYEDDDGDE